MKQSNRILIFLLCLVITAMGTEFVLKDGRNVSGKIIAETGTAITVQINGGGEVLKKSDILEKDGTPYRSSLPPPRKKRAAPSEPEQKQVKENVNEEKKKSTKPWVVTLKNGSVFRGPMISENQRILVLESKGSPVSIFKNVIAEIDSGMPHTPSIAKLKKEDTPVADTVAVTSVQPEKQRDSKSDNDVPKETHTLASSAEGTLEHVGSPKHSIVLPKPRNTVTERDSNEKSSVSEKTQAVSKPRETVHKLQAGSSSVKTAAKTEKQHPPAPRNVTVAMMTVDVVSAEGRQQADTASASVIKTDHGAAVQPQKAVLPRPKPRPSVTSMSAEVQKNGAADGPDTVVGTKKVTPKRKNTKVPAQEYVASSKKETATAAVAEEASEITNENSRTVSRKTRVSEEGGAKKETITDHTQMKIVPAPRNLKVTPKKNQPLPSVRTASPVKKKRQPKKSTVGASIPANATATASVSSSAAAAGGAIVTVVPPLGSGSGSPSPKKKMKPATKDQQRTPVRQTTEKTMIVRPQLPKAEAPPPKTVAKRSDGKKVIIMKNGTEFVGTISSENERFIVFNSEGAQVTIFKHLIREVDGKPYTYSNKTSVRRTYRKEVTGTKRNKTEKKQRRLDVFRVLPHVIVPDNADPGRIALQIRDAETWRDRSSATRNLGAMGQWGVSEMESVVALLKDTTGGGDAIPLWIDSTNERELLTPGFEAARALAQMGDAGESALQKAAENRNRRVRQHAIFGLGYCYSTPSRRYVVEALDDADPEIRRMALGGLEPRKAFKHLKKAIQDRDPNVRDGAVFLLGKIKNDAMVTEIMPLGKNRHAGVRVAVAEVLGAIGTCEGLPVLEKLCNDDDTDVRIAAVKALRNVRDSSVVPVLIDKLGDEHPGIRADAVDGLGRFCDSRSIPALYSAVKDKNKVVRDKAGIALRRHTEIPKLIEMLDDESSVVRENAAYILWLMTGQDNGQDKEKWEKWETQSKSSSP